MYENHLTQSERQKERLEARLLALGGEAKRNFLKDMMNSIGAVATDLLHAGKNQEEKDTRNLMQAYAMESLEIAVYESLKTAAREVNDVETATLAQEIQLEESDAARLIFARISKSATVSVETAS